MDSGSLTSRSAVTGIANLIRKRISNTATQRKLIEELFTMADTNQDGHIQFIEYQQMFRKYGIELTQEEIRMLFIMADKNKDSKISPEELLNDSEEQKMIRTKTQTAFKAYDQNKDGVVTKNEMKMMSGGRLTKEQIDACFEKNDLNGDGVLSRGEMEAMMRRRYEQLTPDQQEQQKQAEATKRHASQKRSSIRPRH